MSAGTSEFFCLICLLLCSCTAQDIVTDKHGQDVILPCKAPNINNINDITAVEWIRPDLDPEHVLLYRNKRLDPDNQHSSYQNRVDLQDKEMKDGEFSLILKNVTMEDTGTYMCRIVQKRKKELISTIFLKVYLSVQEKITAEHGQNIILPCKVPNINNITAVEWSGPGLDPEYVLLYKDGHLDPVNQHPSYQNRVDLQDKEMKDGDASLILKNVKKEDRGIYECRVFEKGKKYLISIINLEVLPPDHSGKIIVGVVVPLVVIILLILAVGFVYWTRNQEKKEKQEEIEPLEGNNPEIIIQLQQEKQKNEFLNSHLRKRAKSDGKLKTVIQNQIQELDEVNSDTNSDPTGSDEKNQQDELEKLQDEKQKWMKTVGNLKTELQNMNQELKLAGTIIVEEVNERDRFIHLRNISSEEIKLKGWKLKLHRNDREPVIYPFNESLKLQPGRILTIWCRSLPGDPDDVYQTWAELQNWNPGDKLEIELFSNKGENFKLWPCE